MFDLTMLENLNERLQFRVTTSEKAELYELLENDGDKIARFCRWCFQNGLAQLKDEIEKQQVAKAS